MSQDRKTQEALEAAKNPPVAEDKIYTQRVFVCPMCDKHRMVRPKDHVVSHETREVETPSGEMVELHVDVCDACQRRIIRKHFQPNKTDLKKVIKAVKDQNDIGEKSLEDML